MNNSNWQERLMEIVSEYEIKGRHYLVDRVLIPFISFLLEEERQGLVSKIEKMAKDDSKLGWDVYTEAGQDARIFLKGYNLAIANINSLLTKKE